MSSSQVLLSSLFFLVEAQVLKQQHLLEDKAFPVAAGRSSFLYLTLLFWNQIFTCFSLRRRQVAISILLSLDKYILDENSLSNSNNWVLVNAVLILLLEVSLPEGVRRSSGVGVESRLSIGGVFGETQAFSGTTGDSLFGDTASLFGVITGNTLGCEATGLMGVLCWAKIWLDWCCWARLSENR
jgi:hypothetical protein